MPLQARFWPNWHSDMIFIAAARFANAAAALSTLGYGAVAPLPRRAEVEALLVRG